MKTAAIHITFDEEKLGALNLYLGLKSLTVESELQAALNGLYQRHVPSQVQNFISLRNDGSPEPVVPKPKRPRPAAEPKDSTGPAAEVTAP